MKQFLGFILFLGSLEVQVCLASGPLDPECTADAKVMLGGRIQPQPYGQWPFDSKARAQLLKVGINFFRLADPNQNFIFHVQHRSPEIFEIMGFLLTHPRLGGKRNENFFMTGGPLLEGPERDEIQKKIVEFIHFIPKPLSWWRALIENFNVETYLGVLKSNLETLVHNLNFGNPQLAKMDSGLLSSFLSPVRIGQTFWFNLSNGKQIPYRITKIDFDLGFLTVMPLDPSDTSRTYSQSRQTFSISDFYEGLSYETRRPFFGNRVTGEQPKEWGAPLSHLFSVTKKEKESDGRVYYEIEGQSEPPKKILEALKENRGSEQDFRNRIRTWKLANGYMEEKGFLIDQIFELFPDMAKRLGWQQLEKGSRWRILNVFDLVGLLGTWNLPLKFSTTPRFLGLHPEGYLRKISFEGTYFLGEQGTPFYHDLFVHLVGLVLLPPKVLEEWNRGAKTLIQKLDEAIAIDKDSIRSRLLQKAVKKFGDHFDNQLYLIFEEFILENSPEMGVFKTHSLKERLAKRFWNLAKFSEKEFSEERNLEIFFESSLKEETDFISFWEKHCEPHVSRILGPDAQKFFSQSN